MLGDYLNRFALHPGLGGGVEEGGGRGLYPLNATETERKSNNI